MALAITQKLVSPHTTRDGTLVQANASHKSFVPMEVFLKPEEYTRRIRSLNATTAPAQDPDSGNPTVTFRGKRRSNQTPVSNTDSDAKLANKGNGTAAMMGFDGGLYCEWLDGESPSVAVGNQCRNISWAGLRDGRRTDVTG